MSHLNQWHRKLGFFAALFLIVLAVTGILLNHSAFLNLDSKQIPSWLAKVAYKAELPQKQVQIGSLAIKQDNKRILVNDVEVGRCPKLFINAVMLAEQIAIVCSREIILLSPEGEFYETVSASLSFPEEIIDFVVVASAPDQLLLRGQQRTTSLNLSTMSIKAMPSLPSSSFNAAGDKLQLSQSESVDLSWERFLADLHSGRVLGLFAVLLMDLAALILIFLVVSGYWVWHKKQQLLKELEDD